MKKKHILILTVLISMLTSVPAYAGNFTHSYRTETGVGYSEYSWFFYKDDKSFAKSEWVEDSGKYYWIGEDGTLPASAGVSDDGFLYNSQGEYIDLNDGKKYMTEDLYNELTDKKAKFKDVLTYNQVIGILGKEHEVSDDYKISHDSISYRYRTYKWYSGDAKSYVLVHFTDDKATAVSSYWEGQQNAE